MRNRPITGVNAMTFRSLDLNLLRVFDVVMTERQVTRAADRLAMSQPAVSNALRRLRETLGEELFIPGATGVTPTHHAQTLWPTVRAALAALQTAIEPAGFDAHRDVHDFRVAMADATAAVVMPGLVEDWQCQGVASALHVVGLDSRDPRPLLEQGHADVAVGFFPDVARDLAGQDGPGLPQLEPLYACRYVAVMRHDHPLAARAELDLDAYCNAQHLRVNFAGRPRGYVDESLARLGRARRVTITVDHFSTAGRIVSQSDLVTVLPRSFVAATGFAPHLAWRDLPFALPAISVGMLWHPRHQTDPAQVWLRQTLRQAATRAAADGR
jgi:DNA-binding transcriptional LysR family regulator